MKYLRKSIVGIMLLLCILPFSGLISGGLTIDYAQAATKSPKLNTSSMTIPIGKMGKDVSWFDSNRNYTTAVPLSVENKVKGATYTFTSSNTKVVKISKKGGYLTGVKKGSAKITCKQTYKNKTTVVGTCKVTIKNTAIEKETWDMCLGEDLFNIEYVGLEYYAHPLPFVILYKKPGAKYTVKCDNKNFILKETTLTEKQKENYYVYDSDLPVFTYSVSKPGTYTFSVMETYKNKAKAVGSFTMTAHDVEFGKEPVKVQEGLTVSAWETIDYSRYDKYYYFWFDNKYSDIIKFVSDDEGYKRIQGLKAGTAVVKLYEDSLEGRYIGQYKVIVEGNTEADNNNNNYGGVVFN